MKDNQDLLFGAGGAVLFRSQRKKTELETEARYLKEIAKSAEALRERSEALERSNRELEQFAYVASHDLQEPLRMVASYTQLLEKRYKGQLDSDADELIAYAVDGATRMQVLINDLLEYSRVGTRGKDLEPTNCEAVLERTLDNLEKAVEESSAKVTCDPLPTVMGDDVQLGQLFQNLITNAIKFRSEEPLAFLNQEGSYADAPRPELILLDLNLPRKDGRDVLAEIKTNGDLKRIPVVVLTTLRSEQDILKSYDFSANCYITKPVDLDQFISVVRSINEFWLSIVKLPGEVELW